MYAGNMASKTRQYMSKKKSSESQTMHVSLLTRAVPDKATTLYAVDLHKYRVTVGWTSKTSLCATNIPLRT